MKCELVCSLLHDPPLIFLDEPTIGTIISYAPLSVQIEINLAEKDIKQAVYDIFDRFPVHDINIENIPIEEVIKHIYQS